MADTKTKTKSPVDERLERQIANYEMPEVRMGGTIIWYRNGTPTARHSMLGWVTRIGNNTVSVHLANGHNRDSVKHVSDPRLRLSGDQREDGGWDFTEDYILNNELLELKQLVERAKVPHLAKLQSRIDALEKSLLALTSENEQLKAKLESLEETIDAVNGTPEQK